jgi:hypothetical protein
MEGVHKVMPVIGNEVDQGGLGHAGHVVLDHVSPACQVGCRAHIREHAKAVHAGWIQAAYKALDLHAINAPGFHPLEMPEHGARVVGAEKGSLGAAGISKAWSVVVLSWREFSHVRPVVLRDQRGAKAAPGPGPVLPADIIVVVGSAEPALVAAEHLAIEGGGIYRRAAGITRPAVGPQKSRH